MKTFTKLAACALVAPLTLGATAAYAQERPAERERAQEQREAQKPADQRRAAEGTQRPDQQRREMAGQADKMGRAGPAASKTPLTAAPANAFHSDWLVGQDIESHTGDENIGTIKDLLVGEDGRIVAVIVGMGGILGMGEKEVAIPWDSFHHSKDEKGDSHFTTSMTQAALQNAPEYDRNDD